MALDTLPEHLLIVGGSYIGLEFAQMYRRFGSRVTVRRVRRPADRPRGPARCRPRCSEILEREGRRLPLRRSRTRRWQAARTAAACASSSTAGTGAHDRRQPPARRGRPACRTPTISASTRPASPTDARGYITVDDELRTSVARRLGAGRRQRPRRLHPHLVQRLRDRRRQPARRRRSAGSPTASPPTRCSSTRRSAASA